MIPRNLLLCAVGLALVCGAFVSGFSWRDSEVAVVRRQADNAARAGDHLRESFEASLAELTRERDEARELSQKLDAEVGQLAKKLAESQAAAVKAAANARAQPSIGNQGSPGSSMKTLAEVFKKPEMKDVVVQQNLAQLDMIYGKLYERLQLDNSEKQDLKSLLSERMRAELEVSMLMMSGDVSPQKAVASGQEILKANAESDQKIRAFLNNETDYQTFQKWEQSKPERMILSMGAAVFAGTGEPLSIAQEDQLVSAMFAARTQVSSVPDMTKPENFTPGNLSPQSSERILANSDAQAAQVAAGAAVYLSPTQMEALKVFQKQQRAMQEMGLKMSAAMMGGK
jgi:hypothetical protein